MSNNETKGLKNLTGKCAESLKKENNISDILLGYFKRGSKVREGLHDIHSHKDSLSIIISDSGMLSLL